MRDDKEAARKELIDNEDERSQLVEMKAKAKTLDIVSNFLFFATAAVMIAYGVTVGRRIEGDANNRLFFQTSEK